MRISNITSKPLRSWLGSKRVILAPGEVGEVNDAEGARRVKLGHAAVPGAVQKAEEPPKVEVETPPEPPKAPAKKKVAKKRVVRKKVSPTLAEALK